MNKDSKADGKGSKGKTLTLEKDSKKISKAKPKKGKWNDFLISNKYI